MEARFGAYRHHVLATLRPDGSPRTSGLEARFSDGEVWLGMMADSAKALDPRRDPRFALQANPGEGTGMGGGDVRIGGRAVEVTEERRGAVYGEEAEGLEPFHLFRVEITEVVRTSVEDGTRLLVQVWKPGRPVRGVRRT
ncbi:pyridoxamine 5'-phosphate oxidase family protein [Streptomyces sp. ZYX-F-203]